MNAGSLTVRRTDAALTDIRWGSTCIASSIHVTMRDERWGTFHARVRSVDEERSADGLLLRWSVVHGDDLLVSRVVVRGDRYGTLVFEMESQALHDFVTRRIGICVLHPWATYVGAGFEAAGPLGTATGTFSHEIAPQMRIEGQYQPLIPAFTRLIVEFAGPTEADFTFEGEDLGFELEDQRNWTDASFKTYPTPLAASAARAIRRGERLWQRLTLRMSGTPSGGMDDDRPVVVRIDEAADRSFPNIGLTAPSDRVEPERIRALLPSHLRVVIRGSSGERGSSESTSLAREAGIPLEVALLIDGTTDIEAMVATLADVPVARLLILRSDGGSTGSDSMSRSRQELPSCVLAVAGGTCSHFSELNRDIPDLAGLDMVALAMSPQVHDHAEAMMVETLEIQTQVIRQASSRCGELPVVVSPVTLAAYAPPDEGNIDPRVLSAFGAAWTVGSAAALAEGGASSITFHEELDRTVLRSERLARTMALLTARGGRPYLAVHSSDPRRVRGLATSGAAPILVNLTDDTQDVQLRGYDAAIRTLEPYEVAVLDRPSR